jgi:hypothetical protein
MGATVTLLVADVVRGASMVFVTVSDTGVVFTRGGGGVGGGCGAVRKATDNATTKRKKITAAIHARRNFHVPG